MTLRPFFGYYGGKWRDAPRYPEPLYKVIVEPFAGSAGYSLRYPECRVVLCEIDPIVVAVWRYLIRVEPAEILAIPDVPLDGTVDDLQIIEEARWLVGFWLNRGVSSPRRRPSRWMRDQMRPGSFWGERVRHTIAGQVEAIRSWKVFEGGYQNCPQRGRATWFVDPPYQVAGRHYRYGADAVDFPELGRWCKSREGQVIVCENLGADWLPFSELAETKTTRTGKRSKEVVWTSAGDSYSVATQATGSGKGS